MIITAHYQYGPLSLTNTLSGAVCFSTISAYANGEGCCDGEFHYIHDVEGLLRFCRSACCNDGRALPFEEDDVRIRCTGTTPAATVLSEVEVTIGCAVLTFDSLVSADLLDSLIRCCLLILDEDNTRHSVVTIRGTEQTNNKQTTEL